jgi:hypothetical protein
MFENSSYSVSESDGSVEVCVVRDEQATLDRPVSVTINTVTGTAVLNDFTPMSAELTFSLDVTRECVSIVIEEDSIVESAEMFAVNLESGDEAANVVTPTASVEIEDGSALRVMFESSMHQVAEGESEQVCLELLDPITRDVDISLETDSADGEFALVTSRYDTCIYANV